MNINYPLEETRFHRLIVSSLRTVFRVFMTLEINGEDSIPVNGAVILAANHVTNAIIL